MKKKKIKNKKNKEAIKQIILGLILTATITYEIVYRDNPILF